MKLNIEEIAPWILAALVVFFLMREVLCWYYKINTMISLQKRQIELLEKIAGVIPDAKREEDKK